MAAVYPTAVKSFSYRQDFTQLVNAADVNVAYDEITAIQNTLGTNPNQDSFINNAAPIGNEYYSWPSVKANIASARRGTTNPSGFFRVFNTAVPFQGDDGAHVPIRPNFSDAPWDTHGIWPGGNALICPRDGIYSFEVYTEWQVQTDPYDFEQTPFDRSGYVQLGLQFYGSGRFLTGYNVPTVQGVRYAPRASCAATWEWTKGTPVQLNLAQTAKLGGMHCCVYVYINYHRALPTAGNL